MRRRGIRVIELEDFMCRCGAIDFDLNYEGNTPVQMACKKCSRKYRVNKIEKKIRISNLPMSFGFRSLYWDKIEPTGSSISAIIDSGYEIQEVTNDP